MGTHSSLLRTREQAAPRRDKKTLHPPTPHRGLWLFPWFPNQILYEERPDAGKPWIALLFHVSKMRPNVAGNRRM